ncbi:threonine/serine dehydratase [candidate division KSB1 bacterium]|nr:threonine/serine dehydratase [candidate division KSB1 bacterium]
MNSNQKLTLPQITFAHKQIQPHIRKTPLEFSHQLSEQSGSEVYLKLENWQKTGSFKIRGALNKMLSLSSEEKQKGIITASAGNHGLGVAHAAKMLGIHGKIVVPENASLAKIKALQNYELELLKQGRDYDEAEEIAWEIQKREDLTFIHAFSDAAIIAGQGTIGLEILEDLPDAQTILVPIGGGGLIAGIAIAAKSINPKVKVVGVQSEASPAMFNSVQAARCVETPIEETIADGLAGRFVAEFTLELTRKHVDEVVLVSENGIKEAIKFVIENEHMLIEGAAAVGVAALLEEKVKTHGKTVVLLTGRNIHSQVLKEILA